MLQLNTCWVLSSKPACVLGRLNQAICASSLRFNTHGDAHQRITSSMLQATCSCCRQFVAANVYSLCQRAGDVSITEEHDKLCWVHVL